MQRDSKNDESPIFKREHTDRLSADTTARAQAKDGKVHKTCSRQPTRTLSIDIDPPSTPSTGKLITSCSCLVASTYSRGK